MSKKQNRININASLDSGIQITLETDFNNRVVVREDGVSIDGVVTNSFSNDSYEAYMVLLRTLRGFDPAVEITYMLGGYTMPFESWFSYVTGRKPTNGEQP
jgi:hypothetical protein